MLYKPLFISFICIIKTIEKYDKIITMVAKINSKISEYKQNFYKICNESVLPLLKKEESERKRTLVLLIIYCIIAFAIAYFIYTDFSSGNASARSMISKFWMFVTGVECFIGIAAAFFVVFAPIVTKNEFALSLKKECMREILKVFGNIKWYDGKNCVSNYYLKDSELFPEFSQRNTYDSFKGKYKDTDFEVSEIHLFNEYGGGGKKIIISTFKGVVIKFDINKEFKGKTIISSKSDFMTKRRFRGVYIICAYFLLLSLISLKTQPAMALVPFLFAVILYVCDLLYTRINKNVFNADLKEIKLEDIKFSKKYSAYSTDQIEGRYLVTSAFMERFQNLQTAFGTNKIKCSFNNNCLMFAISTWKNLFEIGGLFRSLENPKQLDKFFDELISIYMMIDYFKLDEDTKL